MEKAKIYFSDGNSMTVNEGDLVVPIKRFVRDEVVCTSCCEPFELWNHSGDGLIPSILDGLVDSLYFFLTTNKNTIYNTNSITRIESI